MISSTLFRLARSRYGRIVTGLAFAHFVPLLPLRWLHKDADTVAFAHPRPFWLHHHYLIVPRRAVPHLLALDLTKTADAFLLTAIFHTARQVAETQRLDQYTILVNGGAAQDVAQLHFHVAQGRDENGRLWGQELFAAATGDMETTRYQTARAYPHPQPAWTSHYLLLNEPLQPIWPASSQALCDLFSLAQQIVRQQQWPRYTLLININHQTNLPLTFHLVSG
jgi:diadenosine tetraphosphate (Ap4A) HIT family hydrolase